MAGMSILSIIKEKLINNLSFIYANLIALNLYILKKRGIKLFYNHSIGFGDSFSFYVSQYLNIYKNKVYVFNFGYLTDQTIRYLFDNKKIIKSFFYIYKIFPHYRILFYLRKNINFAPTFKKNSSIIKTYQLKNTDFIKNLLIDKLMTQSPSFDIKKIFTKKYICISIKHYSKDKNSIITGSKDRSTSDLTPVIKTILYLISKNIQIFILGLNNDKSVSEFKKIFKKNNNVKFFNDISEKYSFTDQVYIAKNSIGLLGSAGGIFHLYYFLQKKSLLINVPFNKSIFLYPQNSKHEKKYNKYLFKKIFMNSKVQILSDKIKKTLSPYSKFEIIENSSRDIIAMTKFFFKN